MTLKKAKEVIELDLEEVKIPPETDPEIQEMTRVLQEKGYKWLEQKVTYAGVNQRWLIVESAERKKSDIQKLESKIEQEKKTALKLAKKLCKYYESSHLPTRTISPHGPHSHLSINFSLVTIN